MDNWHSFEIKLCTHTPWYIIDDTDESLGMLCIMHQIYSLVQSLGN